MGVLDKIFDNFEMLYDNYADMPETQEARKPLFCYPVEKGIDIMEVEDYLTTLTSEYERQGFLYAVSLILDGKVRVNESNGI